MSPYVSPHLRISPHISPYLSRSQGWLFEKKEAEPFWSVWSKHSLGKVYQVNSESEFQAKRRKLNERSAEAAAKARGDERSAKLRTWIEKNASETLDFLKYKGDVYNRAELIRRGVLPPSFPDDFDPEEKAGLLQEWQADRERRKRNGAGLVE